MTWNFTCSTTETSTWAQAGRKFGELMEQATGGKIKVEVYAADQLTGGNQSEGIQALMNGDPVQISMHSNLIYSAFDPRFNVVSLPYLFDSVAVSYTHLTLLITCYENKGRLRLTESKSHRTCIFIRSA